jgi:hypothetical protein
MKPELFYNTLADQGIQLTDQQTTISSLLSTIGGME